MEKVRPWCGQPSDRGRLRNRTEQADAPYPGRGSNQTSNQRNTAHVALYCTWHPSGLATGLRGQRCYYSYSDSFLGNLSEKFFFENWLIFAEVMTKKQSGCFLEHCV